MKKVAVKNSAYLNVLKKVNKRDLMIGFVFVAILAAGYNYYHSKNPVRSELSKIQKIATEYKNKNGNFGVVLNNKSSNCFSGNTFIKAPEMTTVLTTPDVENISCIFKVASRTNVVEAWSVTIVKGEKAYCEDSSGVRMETPGLTTKETCKAE